MSQLSITNRLVSSLKPKSKPYFIRDCNLKGFGLKVNQSGQVNFIAEVWCNGKSRRKTLGAYPFLSLQQARSEALAFISAIKSGSFREETAKQLTLRSLFNQYISGGRLKATTIRDYQEAIFFYLSDWLDIPVISITKQMVETRFFLIRDKGFNGGIPTYSQATKTMRILSALLNYARGDELIDTNPVEILKLKRIDRSIQKRENYLRLSEARELLKATEADNHPVALAIRLMLYSGLRKNEALSLRWRDIQDIEGLRVLAILDTKNHRPHFLPITPEIQNILDRSSKQSEYLFPSPQNQNSFIRGVRSKLNGLCKAVGAEFKCHDLRRTFATRAAEVGVDFLMIKRLLNHKSNSDITAQYIQWNSRENLHIALKSLEKVHY